MHGIVSLQLFPVLWIFWGPWVPFVTTDEFLVRVTRIISSIVVSWTHSLSFCCWPIFNSMNYGHINKRVKPDNFESHTSLKLGLTNIWGLCLDFVECESFLESNSPDILALCETNLDDSIDSGNFSVRGYLPLIQKDSGTHMHGLAVYVKTSFCTRLISRKLCRFLLMFSTGFTSLSVLLTFPLSVTFIVFMNGFWCYFI